MGSLDLNVQLGAQKVAPTGEHDDFRARDDLNDTLTQLEVPLEDALAESDMVRLEQSVECGNIRPAHKRLPLFEGARVKVICLIEFFLVVPVCDHD